MEAGIGQTPNEAHFGMVANAAHSLVVFLGSGANADEYQGRPWEADSGTLPDDRDLARELATKAGLNVPGAALAEVAQYARTMHGKAEVSDWLREILSARDEAKPGRVHRQLAGLPKQFKDLWGEPRYQMIVTAGFDAALEKALTDAGEEFDVAVYLEEAGRFVHRPYDGLPQTIETPNKYPAPGELGFPIAAANRRLSRTVVVRISGSVCDTAVGFDWEDNYVITEDQYIDYLSGLPAEQAVPAQILSKLKRSSYLFLGYRFSDWRLRVFLHRVWGGPKFEGENYWAVEREPDQLEGQLWTQAGVALYQSALSDYLEGLEGFIRSHAKALQQ